MSADLGSERASARVYRMWCSMSQEMPASQLALPVITYFTHCTAPSLADLQPSQGWSCTNLEASRSTVGWDRRRERIVV